ncbi:MAG: acyltransferase domain-containing protein [Eubacteriales bacterium]|nr:acyltransferase domain-containing protein [Eubacteriales bacterium]
MERLFTELQYPEHIEEAVKRKLSKPGITEIANAAYSDEQYDFPLCKRMPLTRLAVVTWLLHKKHGEYKRIGVPDTIIFDTFRDVTLRATLYYRKTEKVGISKEDVIWFRHIMNVNMFKVGVLQFQPFEMVYLDEETIGEHYVTFSKEQKNSLPNGAPVINCHIQRNADLSLDRVTASMNDAKELFLRIFPEKRFQAFLCYSWLLYPQMTKNLSPESRIKQFSHLFEIIGESNDSEQAIENLFDDGKRRELPIMSSLQKMAIEHLDWFGFACGIIKLNNN